MGSALQPRLQPYASGLQPHVTSCNRAVNPRVQVGAPSIFFASWKLIRPMFDPVTASKVHEIDQP